MHRVQQRYEVLVRVLLPPPLEAAYIGTQGMGLVHTSRDGSRHWQTYTSSAFQDYRQDLPLRGPAIVIRLGDWQKSHCQHIDAHCLQRFAVGRGI